MDSEMNNQTTSSVAQPRKWVSDEAQMYIETAFFVVMSGLFATFGCVANVANITVFLKQGLQESATVSLFCLSISDLGLSLTTVVSAISNALDKAQHDLPVDFRGLHYYISIPRGCFNDLSMCTIVVLSLERCLCVMKPLTFKHLITRLRTMVTLGIMYTEVIVLHVLLLSTRSLTWQFNALTNSTRLQLYTAPLGPGVSEVHRVINGVAFPFTAMILVISATCALVYGLQEASKFRIKSSRSTSKEAGRDRVSTMSARDVRLVKTVIYVSTMYIICYLPFMTIFFVRAIEPEVNYFKAQHNLNQTFWGIIYAAVAINSSANIFVYLTVSTKYGEIFTSTYCGKAKEKTINEHKDE